MTKLSFVAAFVLAYSVSPAFAQVQRVTEAGPYQIARAAGGDVCFAVVELVSESDKPMVYTHYATPFGQRWTVAGYALESALEDGTVALEVAIDGEVTLARETETRSGDFMLPFENLAEIEAHEALIKTGETMSILIDGADTLNVPLVDYRLALEGMSECLLAVQ